MHKPAFRTLLEDATGCNPQFAILAPVRRPLETVNQSAASNL
jgi:hypothetical protein